MKLILTAGDLVLDIDKMSKTVQMRAHQKMRQAARIFLRETIKHIPVWTGEAMGSLAPIAHELHVKIPSIKHPEAPFNGFSMGMTQGTSSSPFIKQDDWKFSFQIGTDVKHFNINDAYDVSKWGITLRNKTPWKSFEKGAEAAADFLRRTGHTIVPNFADFVVIKNVVTYA